MESILYKHIIKSKNMTHISPSPCRRLWCRWAAGANARPSPAYLESHVWKSHRRASLRTSSAPI